MKIVGILSEIGFFDLLDIVVMSFLIYTLLVWFKKTRAAFVLTGILIIAGFYLVARQFNLYLTASVFQGFFAVILVAVVIIFQEELRHFFERVAVLGLRPRLRNRDKVDRLSRGEVAILVRVLTDLAKEKIGALIVVKGKDLILRHLEGGHELGGRLSEPLIQSLFDPHSEGHDGAVIVEGNRVTHFSVHLPLSKNFKQLGKGGTRHAAALGLTELTDALCLVVSEERGTISVARHGEIFGITDPDELNSFLEKFYREIHPRQEPRRWSDYFTKNTRQKGGAIGIAVLLWFLHVYGSKPVYRTFEIPIELTEMPEGLKIAEVDPPEVEVTFSGPRRVFYFLEKNRIRLLLKTWKMKEGLRAERLSPSDFTVPKNIVIENIEPIRIKVHVVKTGEEEKPSPNP